MSIHDTIRQLREGRGWSHADLARYVSEAEGLTKHLSWQTVQQWERPGGTAPKRTRLPFVAKAFGVQPEVLLGSTPAPAPIGLRDALPVVLGALPGLSSYRAEHVLQALRSATQPGAPLEQIERDLLQWLGEDRQDAAPAQLGKRTGTR